MGIEDSDRKYTLASFFAGVGGIDLGFERTGRVRTIYANELDPYPVETFEANFDLKVDCRDIHDVFPVDVPNVDMIAGGFPCQAFSIAGLREGFTDTKGRGTLFFELMRIVQAKKPKVVFLENVKNLVSHDHGNTFKVIIGALEKSGYHCQYKVLNAMRYGNTPQNRERIYIVAFRDEDVANRFQFPDEIELITFLIFFGLFLIEHKHHQILSEMNIYSHYILKHSFKKIHPNKHISAANLNARNSKRIMLANG